MDIETTARIYALELLVTQLISEYLRSVADPEEQARWATDHLRGAAEAMPVQAAGLDEEARIRLRVKDDVSGILAAALARAKAIPLRPPSWDRAPPAG
jgi:hypothetical protein